LKVETTAAIIGVILINGSLAAFILHFGRILSGPKIFRRRNIFRSVLSVILFVPGLALVITFHLETSLTLVISFLSVSVLYLVTKAFLLIEDSENYSDYLLQELKTTRNSLSHGLAMGYFYNFLVPVCENINIGTEVLVEKGRGEMVKTNLSHPYFFVVIPSSLPEDKIKESVNAGLRDKHFGSCKIMNNVQHRPMFFNLTKWDETSMTSDGLFDIPTTIGTLINFSRLESPKNYSIELEITKFQNVLVFLIAKHPHIAEKIRIISIPWPINFQHLNAVIDQAFMVPPPEFAPGLTLSPTQTLRDWLSGIEDVIDNKEEDD